MNKEAAGITELIILLALLFMVTSEKTTSNSNEVSDSRDSVCPSLFISKSLFELNQLRTCTKVEGNLEILRMDEIEDFSEFDGYSFPKLNEITGFLIIYRVNRLKSLAQLFPNLTIIRGETLIYDYALVVYEMQDLEELGLWSLTKVMKGGIKVEGNPRLCYLSTIHWSYIIGDGSINFSGNKARSNCIEDCPMHEDGLDSCNVTEVPGYGRISRQPRCWDSSRCQRICPEECKLSSCYWKSGRYECCHAQCVGGCVGSTDRDCVACANVFHNGTCVEHCPLGTLKLGGRWCMTEDECIKGGTWYEPGKIFNEECLMECPNGYADNDRTHLCTKCINRCPKVCGDLIIDSVSSAQANKGCTVIDGVLEIKIQGGSNVAQHLEENLGMIEEVKDFVKIFRAYSLMSLRFLKNLKLIHGNKLSFNKYSFVVLDNQNLQDIWDLDDHPDLTIKNGKLFFHSNRKLCLDKIRLFVRSLGRSFSDIGESEISRSTNGDQMSCQTLPMEVRVMHVTSTEAYLEWDGIKFPDMRVLLGYMVFYRKVSDNENVTMYSERDACDFDTWKTEILKEYDRSILLHQLQHLEPYTKYAVYVQTYGTSNSDAGLSPIVFFTTRHDVPSMPRNMVISSNDPNILQIRWSPPAHPHGIITHYRVYWRPIIFNGSGLTNKNYCSDRSFLFKMEETDTVGLVDNNTDVARDKCCSCFKESNEKLDLEIDYFERYNHIKFEDLMQNKIYKKFDKSNQTRKRRNAEESFQSNKTNVTSAENLYLINNSTDFILNKTNVSSAETFYLVNNGTDFVLNKTNVSSAENLYLVSNSTEVVLSNLHHYQEYSIEVRACHDKDDKDKGVELCSLRLFGTGMTLEKKSADDIDASNVKHALKNGTKLSISWLPPSSPNGMILLYEMELEELERGQRRTACVSQKDYGLLHSHVIEGLTPGNWSFRIRSTSRASVGSWTKTFYVYVPHKGSSNVALNVGASVFSVFVIACLIVGIICWYVWRRRRHTVKLLRISNNPNYLLAEDAYVPDEWEVERSKVTCLKELGSGSFGKVFEGTVQNLIGFKDVVKVAIKTTHKTATTQDIICFLNEASRMKVFRNGCNHVVKLYGVVSQGRPPYVIMELMSNGDLREYLRCCRSDSQGTRSPPTLKEIFKMAAEIADGMAFLESKSYVHRDLASRNCLISEDMVVKIADFGMTRDIYMTDYYRKGSAGMLPIRWMPKESIQDGYFDHKSDVWSYGVVLWEIITLGHQPYMGLTNEQVCQFVTNGGCPNQPEGCPTVIAELMSVCWERNPTKRASFSQVLETLSPHLPQEFMTGSFYFNQDDLPPEKLGVAVTPKDSDIPLEYVHPNGSICDETTLITKVVPLTDTIGFNHRGLPMPISHGRLLQHQNTYQDENNPIVTHHSGDTTGPLIMPDYANCEIQKSSIVIELPKLPTPKMHNY